MNSKTLKSFLNNSYENNHLQNIDDYILDHSLSGKRAQVYSNPSGKSVVVHRGTQGIHDLITDTGLVFGYKSKRFDHAKKIQSLANQKYGKDNVTTLGHSLGSVLAEDAVSKNQKLITLNKPVTYGRFNKIVPDSQTDIVTSGDLFDSYGKH